MPSGLILLAANPSLCIGAPTQQSGTPVKLVPVTGTNPAQIIWSWSTLSGQITLQSTMSSPTPLVLTTSGCGAQTPITVNNRVSGQNLQQWQWFGTTAFLTSAGCAGMVIDNQYRTQSSSNVIWLFPNNGSPAQQWILQSMDQMEVMEALDAVPA